MKILQHFAKKNTYMSHGPIFVLHMYLFCGRPCRRPVDVADVNFLRINLLSVASPKRQVKQDTFDVTLRAKRNPLEILCKIVFFEVMAQEMSCGFWTYRSSLARLNWSAIRNMSRSRAWLYLSLEDLWNRPQSSNTLSTFQIRFDKYQLFTGVNHKNQKIKNCINLEETKR